MKKIERKKKKLVGDTLLRFLWCVFERMMRRSKLINRVGGWLKGDITAQFTH